MIVLSTSNSGGKKVGPDQKEREHSLIPAGFEPAILSV